MSKTRKIVLVNDDANFLQSLQHALELRGYEAHTFVEPEAALSFMRSPEGRDVGLVITDCTMFDAGHMREDAGVHLSKAIRAENPNAVIFLQTGLSYGEVNGFLPNSEHVGRENGNAFIDRCISTLTSINDLTPVIEQAFTLYDARLAGASPLKTPAIEVPAGAARPNYFQPGGADNAVLLLSPEPAVERFLSTLTAGMEFSIIRAQNEEAARAVMTRRNVFALMETPGHSLSDKAVAGLFESKPDIPVIRLYAGQMRGDDYTTLPLSNNSVNIDVVAAHNEKWLRQLFIAPILASEGRSLSHALPQANRHAAYERMNARLRAATETLKQECEDPITQAIYASALAGSLEKVAKDRSVRL